jgi:transposase-like protein
LPNFTEEQAREHLESLFWPSGPVCPHCEGKDVYRLTGPGVRAGVRQCRGCTRQFTVTVGTIFEDSHIPLATWIRAFHLMATSKKGISALQLQRNLGLGSYRTAWHMAHRIRLAMKCEPFAGALRGEVEVDETYVGGKPRPGTGPHKRGRGTEKTPVVALVQRQGGVRTRVVERVTAKTLQGAIREAVGKPSVIVTDEFPAYRGIGRHYDDGHFVVNHGLREYVNGPIHTNTAESFFALLKRGVHGTFHHVSKKHLRRYCDEFGFRWDNRKVTDTERTATALKQSKGKRLPYRKIVFGNN